MLSFLRFVLGRDEELNTRQSNSADESPYQPYNNYGTFSRTILPVSIPSTQTATRAQPQNYSTVFNFPQKSVYNQPKQTLPRINAKVTSGVDPEKPPDISTSSSSCLLLPPPPSPELGSSFSSSSSSPFSAYLGSPKSPVSTKPTLAPSVSTQTSKQAKTQCNAVLEKGLLYVLEDIKGLIRKDVVPGVSKKPLSPKTYPDYFAAPRAAEDYHLEVPAKRSLADYLTASGPRLVSLYGSTELYPTDEARCIIQGMVTAILNLKKEKRKHNYLWNPENLILEDKKCHPYSNYVRDLATGDVLINRKILEQAGKDFPTTTEVTLEKNKMNFKGDDLAALEHLIFDVILVLDDDKKPLLPAEWKSFKKLFSNTKLDYAVLSSHPCLWGYTKRLGFYLALDRWCNPSKSEKGVRDIVVNNLSSMQIFKINWVKRIKSDSHLLTFTGKMRRSRQRKVYGLIRFFRNLVEHCPDKAKASSPYKEERYLDYRLRILYPNLLEEIHQRLLHAGFTY